MTEETDSQVIKGLTERQWWSVQEATAKVNLWVGSVRSGKPYRPSLRG